MEDIKEKIIWFILNKLIQKSVSKVACVFNKKNQKKWNSKSADYLIIDFSPKIEN